MQEFSLNTPVEEMDEADLRSTLDEFMEQHAENVESYQAVKAERDEFSQEVDALTEQVEAQTEITEALTETFAAVVADESPLFDAEEVAERFSLPELLEKADALGVFSLQAPEGDGDEEAAEAERKFSDRPDRAPTGEDAKNAFRAQAEADLKTILGDF